MIGDVTLSELMAVLKFVYVSRPELCELRLLELHWYSRRVRMEDKKTRIKKIDAGTR